METQAYLLRCITQDLFSASFHIWAQPGLVSHCAGCGTRTREPRLEEMDPNGELQVTQHGRMAWILPSSQTLLPLMLLSLLIGKAHLVPFPPFHFSPNADSGMN